MTDYSDITALTKHDWLFQYGANRFDHELLCKWDRCESIMTMGWLWLV